jgi:transcriptional regulator with XRE-family HTH domain
MTAAERVRQRVIALMEDLDLSQRQLAERVGRTQPWVAKVVRGPKRGGQDVRLEDLDDLAMALGVTAVEMVRDPGLEFVADLTPSEMRILEQLRRIPQTGFDAVRTLLSLQRIEPKKLSSAAERLAIATAAHAAERLEAEHHVDAAIEARKKAGPLPTRRRSDTRPARKVTK